MTLRAALFSFCLMIAPTAVSAEDALRQAVENNPFRSDAEKVRDKERHPYETLRFFGIKPDMAIAEIGPGGGWYTNILAPYLKDKGRYIGVNYSPALMQDESRRQAYIRWGETFTVDKAKFGPNAATAYMAGPEAMVEAESLDMVLTIRGWHNWIASGLANSLAHEFFRALRPGGVLGVVQHRADPNNPPQPGQNTGYVDEAFLISVMEAAGFKLAAKSDINANPKDTKNWPRGVWTLPPTFALGDVNREAYAAIGESDRMTLKFVKP